MHPFMATELAQIREQESMRRALERAALREAFGPRRRLLPRWLAAVRRTVTAPAPERRAGGAPETLAGRVRVARRDCS